LPVILPAFRLMLPTTSSTLPFTRLLFICHVRGYDSCRFPKGAAIKRRLVS
jgi:hypothetical protein